jgi:hypothetical protein
MSSKYRKIKYETEGPYGTTEEKYLYVWSHDTVDVVHVYDDNGEELFCYSETGFDMSQALAVIGTNWQDPRLEPISITEFENIRNQTKTN